MTANCDPYQMIQAQQNVTASNVAAENMFVRHSMCDKYGLYNDGQSQCYLSFQPYMKQPPLNDSGAYEMRGTPTPYLASTLLTRASNPAEALSNFKNSTTVNMVNDSYPICAYRTSDSKVINVTQTLALVPQQQ
jgi:hypothetical protein